MSESNKNEWVMPYPAFDEKTGKINCQICGKPYLVISPKHLKNHGITHADYTSRYPEAPLSSKDFATKAKYGKVKDLFAPRPDNESLEEIIVEKPLPTIDDEIDVDVMLKAKSQYDPIVQSRTQVKDILREKFSNIKVNYLIEEISNVSGKLLCHYITDFTDPILRIVIQFPKAFWHNKDTQPDPLKYENLTKLGWKVFIIDNKNPTREEIQKIIG